ncbi:MAG TPA: ComEC/Rec2 family competence protein [Chlamydiae bacterium]|nr:hypothetical protein [Candidatus Anoxychlamydiales bacterium]HEU64286.1 ComEC/Rec2 family competence protein [Chlamydiota bacterium]
MKNLKFIADFFYFYPSLLYALFFLLGISNYLLDSFFLYLISALIFLLLIFSLKNKVKLFLAAFFYFFAFAYLLFFYSDIKNIKEPIQGVGYFKISSIKESYSFNRRYYIYSGILKTFESDNKRQIKNIKTSIFSKKKFQSNFLYKAKGTLIPTENFQFQFRTNNLKKVKPIKNFAHQRFYLKKSFESFLKKSIFDKASANFLHTLITGENRSKFLSFSFSKIGLQHVLAISGFHFGIFTLFFSYFLNLFFSKKLVIYILIFLVSLYFLFIGPIISVQRAFMMIQMALFAMIMNRRYFALNALGISLIVILLIDPINIIKLGFQLSYLSTFAILLAFPTISKAISKVLKKRDIEEINDLNIQSKIGYRLLTYIRDGISLLVAVNIFILPVILYHFHKLSCLSFIYNLFIPFLVGISMVLVIFGFIFHFILPPLGFCINYINTYFTKFILKLITYPPAKIEFYLRYKNLSFEFVIIYLGIITISFLMLRYYLKVFHSPENTPEYCNYL